MVHFLSPRWQRRLILALLPLAAACGSSLKTKSPNGAPASAAPAAVAPVVQAAPVQDPVLTLITASNDHFLAGERELAQGHFDAAKVEFNRAVDILLQSPYGARTEPRIREH